MRKKTAPGLVLGLSLLVSGLVVGARRVEAQTIDPTTYTYTGNLFTTFSGTLPSGVSRITGSFTLANPLGPNSTFIFPPNPAAVLSFSFSDGVTTLTPGNASIGGSWQFTTGPTGNIIHWDIIVNGLALVPIVYLNSRNTILGGVFDTSEYFLLQGPAVASNVSPGTWTASSTTVVPEPSSLILLGTGLFGLAPLLRRRFARPR